VNALRTELLTCTGADRLIVYVGRLVEEKQIHVFIDAIKTINQLGINTAGVIVGDGDKSYVTRLKNMSVEVGITSKIVFTGFSSQPELYIKAGDFCIFPTLHAEALPRFILESFSQHRTLIVSNHPSIKGIITDRFNSMIVKEHTSHAYAEMSIQLIQDPDLLKDLEIGAKLTYDENFEVNKVISQYKELYSEFLDPPVSLSKQPGDKLIH
jgi:glycosyltransferase involved in cell wall biosynthesis